MNSIEVMVNEHKYIMRMLAVVRRATYGILQGEAINDEDFRLMIEFIREYADKHHHGKEEKFLFKEIMNELGELGIKLIRNGMLVEHDLGRFYIAELCEALNRVNAGDDESKLDVIANAISYTHLLTRHIQKEDSVVYTFAEKQLSPETLQLVNNQSEEFEKEAEKEGRQAHYITLLESLERKYGLSAKS